MATGDQQDILQRLKSTLPPWFGDETPIIDGLLNGFAWAGSFVYGLIQYVRLQSRIKTATDAFLDMISADFFGIMLLRKINESDIRFRIRIIANLFRERATRNAIVRVLQDITGRTPRVFEPLRPMDTGGYGVGGFGFSVAGGYGSILLPFQCFVDAFRPEGSGIPLIAGYGVSSGGYGVASRAEYATTDMVQMSIQDAEIYEAIDSVKPAGTIIWTRINN